MTTEHPRIGDDPEKVSCCPHCGFEHTFEEFTLHRGNRPGYPILIHRQNGSDLHCAGQTCNGCEGLLVYVDGVRIFPYRDLPNVSYVNVPEALREAALQAYQIKDFDPALAAVGLRRVLERMCMAAAFSITDGKAYFTIIGSLTTLPSEARGLLLDTCQRQGQTLATTDIYAGDKDSCVTALAKLVGQVADALFG